MPTLHSRRMTATCAWFNRNWRALAFAIFCAALIGATLIIVTQPSKTAPPPVTPPAGVSVPMFHIAPKSNSFRIVPGECRVSFPRITAQLQDGICTLTASRADYPAVFGKGGDCRDLDLTAPENSGVDVWVVRLRGSAPFVIEPVTWSVLEESLPQPVPMFDFRGTITTAGEQTYGLCENMPASPN